MKHHLLLLGALALYMDCMGQPVIHATAHLPTAGTFRPIGVTPMSLAEPPGGIAATWDFTWLSAAANDTLWYVDPAFTLQGAAFAGAVAVVDSISPDFANVRYQALLADELVDLGYEMYYCPLEGGRLLLPSELALGYSSGDPYYASCTYESIDSPLFLNFVETGTSSLVADGWGTLLMPWGVVDGVLRTTTIWQYLANNPPPAQDLEYLDEVAAYWHEDAIEPVVRIKKRSQRPLGSTQWTVTANHVEHIIEIGLGLTSGSSPAVRLQPNPATEETWLSLSSDSREAVFIEVIDALGRIQWAASSASLAPGARGIQIPTRNLHAGQYVVRVKDAEGQQTIAKLLKV